MKSISYKTAILLSLSAAIAACGGGGGGGGGGSGSGGGSGGGGGGGSSSHTIGGNISGIAADKVTISNSGSSSQEHTTDGSFSFTVDSGASYEILVDINPLEQFCTVSNGSGSNVNSSVNNISISCEAASNVTSCSSSTDSDNDELSDCEELTQHFTNPWVDDTDGDSFLDGREVNDYDPSNNRFIFNPRVADMAKIAIELTAVPEIDLDFSQGTSGSRTVSTTYEQSESQSIESGWGGETSRQLEVGHTLSVENTQTVGAEVSVSPTDLGVTGSYENSLSVGFESSVTQTQGSSVNWSNSATTENTRAYNETVELTEEENSTYDGGFLRVTARVINDGHIAYDLENLTLSAVLFDTLRPFDIESIGTMEFSNGGFPATTILPGESAPLNFSTDLTLGKAQTLLRESENIVITPGTYRLLDINDQSLLLVDSDVSARTATVTVDYGVDAAREDKYRVAINRGSGQRSLSIRDALTEVIGLTITEGSGEWIFGNDTSPSSTFEGLTALGSYPMSSQTNRYWLIAHNLTVNASTGERETNYYNLLQEAYDLGDILLRAGDKLSLVYVGDSDRDAISDRMERELGTNPDALDTDGDGLGDGLELYGWLTNLQAPPCDQGSNLTRVYSNPLLVDSDDDGVDDFTQRESCENPSFNFVADAGEEQIVNRDDIVTLNASITGVVSEPPTYDWTLVSGPDVVDEFGNITRQLEGRRPMFVAPDDVTSLVWEVAATIAGEVQTDRTTVQVQLNRNEAIYIGPATAGQTANGTREAPYGSISEALASMQQGDDLYIMSQAGGYQLVNTLSLPDGTSIFGGYDANWIRDVENNKTEVRFTTTLNQPAIFIGEMSEDTYVSGLALYSDGSAGSAGNNVTAILVEANPNTTAPVYITDNRVESSNVGTGTSANPGSSYALRVNGQSILRLTDNMFIAGNGGVGVAGSPGGKGADGDDASGRTRGSGSSSGGDGGTGGERGGAFDAGEKGGNGGSVGSAIGGTGGSGSGCFNEDTHYGEDGDNGVSGANGAGGVRHDYTSFASEFVISVAGRGQSGTHGAGGGGGGGGSGCGTARGGHGGGGGEGGAGGTGGYGGTSGGASIAVWLNAVDNVELRNNSIVSGNGGAAGRGGSRGGRGIGGDGGSGQAPGEVCVLVACDRGRWGWAGGDGGNGGYGGYGGGGTGGASFGVFVASSVAPLMFDNNVSSGDAANGGGSTGNGGRGGDSYAIFDADLNDGFSPELNGNTLTPGSAGAAGNSNASAGSAGATNF